MKINVNKKSQQEKVFNAATTELIYNLEIIKL